MQTRHSTPPSLRLKLLVLLLAFASLPTMAASGAAVLLYHHVAESTPAITSVKPDDFAAQMAFLAEGPFTVVTAATLVESLQTGTALPDHAVVITFDDAYLSVYTTALPILERHGFPAILFVATDLVGTNDRLYLTWDQLRDMQARGVTIANHTSSHVHLLRAEPGESDTDWLARMRGEITNAQAIIRQEMGSAPMLFAYPYGEFNNELLTLVSDLGYVGFGQQSGAAGPWSSLLALPRFPLAGVYAGFDAFRTKARSLPLPNIEPASEPTAIGEDHRPELRITLAEGKWRASELACYGPGGRMEIDRDGNHFTISPVDSVPVGRSRYNCTMPSFEAGRYHWYSQPWIRRRDDGSWYPEP